MNPTEIPLGSEIKCEMNGDIQIIISDDKAKKVGRSPRAAQNLCFYSGHFCSGKKGEVRRDASILVYASEIGKTLHNQLTRFDHPNVMRSLGYAKGYDQYSKYTFVAFPVIQSTLGELLVPGSGAAEMGRFTQLFIDVVCQSVKGIKSLHDNGFCCPNLQGRHIVVNVENGCVSVKIWNFRPSGSDKDKDSNWGDLATLLARAARNNNASGPESLEISDLLTNMKNGKLKGLDILTHSALCNVRQKIDRVFALHLNVKLHHKPKEPEQPSTNSAENQPSTTLSQEQSTVNPKESYNLEEYLDVIHMEARRPPWMSSKRRAKHPINFRGLLDDFRDVFEHEIEYIPEEMTMTITVKQREDGTKELDLEHYLRKTWPKSFLKMLVWALDPSAKLPK